MTNVTAQDLFNPGAAEHFFGFAPKATFDPSVAGAFSPGNALWLAEFSRLIYRRGPDEMELPAGWRTRNQILAAHGWRETHCIAEASARAAIFVCDALRVACLVFRGTLDPADVVSDAQFLAVRWRKQDASKGYVHQGFKAALNRVWTGVAAALGEIPYPVFYTGHSLGGALATLAAARALHRQEVPNPAALYTFGSPRTGDAGFGQSLAGLFHCRVVNEHDLVAGVPAAFSLPMLPVYRHCGRLHRLRPGGALEAEEGEDVGGGEDALPAVRDLAENLGRLFAGARESGAIPQNLLDHAPLYYVARLAEIAGNASPGRSV